jgi:hypothetical protein
MKAAIIGAGRLAHADKEALEGCEAEVRLSTI